MRSVDIEAHLRRFIIGQDEAVRTLAVAAGAHYARAAYGGKTPLRKANVLIAGPSGSGKTAMVRSLAQLLDVPFAMIAAPAITQPGFTGLDPDTVLQMLLAKAGGDKDLAGRGIAYIDEVDKIARKTTDDDDKGKNLTTGLGVQQALLDVLDAQEITFADGNGMDARNVLFILSGAFIGIEHVVQRRVASRASGRPRPLSLVEALRQIEPLDLIAYGLIPEFVGRCPVIATLRPLDPHEIMRILTEPEDAPLRRITAEFEAVGATLEVDQAFLHQLATAASQHPLGARSLEVEVRKALESAFYLAAPGSRFHVHADGWVEHQIGSAA